MTCQSSFLHHDWTLTIAIQEGREEGRRTEVFPPSRQPALRQWITGARKFCADLLSPANCPWIMAGHSWRHYLSVVAGQNPVDEGGRLLPQRGREAVSVRKWAPPPSVESKQAVFAFYSCWTSRFYPRCCTANTSYSTEDNELLRPLVPCCKDKRSIMWFYWSCSALMGSRTSAGLQKLASVVIWIEL